MNGLYCPLPLCMVYIDESGTVKLVLAIRLMVAPIIEIKPVKRLVQEIRIVEKDVSRRLI